MHTEIFNPCVGCPSPISCTEGKQCYGIPIRNTVVNAPVYRSNPYGGMVGGIYVEIATERRRAHAKHDTTGHSAEKQGPMWWRWMPILTEELGESAEAWQDLANAEPEQYGNALRHLKTELVQVAAMAAAWADSVQRGIDLWEIER